MISEHPGSSTKRKQAVFQKVSQNLYRLSSSGKYYALLKCGGKQIHKPLKTRDRKRAERNLNKFKIKLQGMILKAGKITFGALAKQFRKTILASKDLKGASGNCFGNRAAKIDTSPMTSSIIGA